ncbi:MAG: ABC transporter permease [Oligoflexales bacterium]
MSLAIVLVNWLGFLSFGILEQFKDSFDAAVDDISQNLLSADLSISSRIDFSDEVKAKVRGHASAEGWDVVESVSFYTMLRKPGAPGTSDKSLLVNVRAVDPGFPLYGKITGKDQDETTSTIAQMHSDKAIWASPEVMARLAAQPGDEVALGDQTLRLSHTVQSDTTVGLNSFDLAPRIYIDRSLVEATGLFQKGSVTMETLYLKIPPQHKPSDAKKALAEFIKDPAVRIQTHDDHENGRARVINYLTDYLWLISLICVLLTATGVSYQFRSYLASKKNEIALFLCLGTSPLRIVMSYLGRITLLSSIASILTVLGSALALPLFQKVFEQFVTLPPTSSLSWISTTKILAVSIVFPFLVCLPFCLSVFKVKPSSLFREEPQTPSSSRIGLLWLTPAVLLFAAVAVWKSHSYFTGLLFCGIVVISVVVFYLTSKILIASLAKANFQKPITLKLSTRFLTRSPTHTNLFIVALGLSTLLISIAAHLRSTLAVELERPSDRRADLFVFDIQEDQLADLKSFYDASKDISYKFAPMVRGRMTKINGEVLRTRSDDDDSPMREDQRSGQARNRSVNISYFETNFPDNPIVEGVSFAESRSKYAKVSLEQNYASRVGLEINDIVTFDIMGKEIEGEVVNLRKVNWTNFDPNFFIILEPGPLRDAPKTFVGSVAGVGNMAGIYAMQTEIANRFPNMSVVNVKPIIEQVLSMVSKLSLIINFMSAFSLLVGLVVIGMILQHRLHTRRRDYQMITLLGGAEKMLPRLVFTEISVLTLGAVVVATASGAVMSYIIVKNVFDRATVDLSLAFTGLFASLAIPFLATLFVRSRSEFRWRSGQSL